MYSFHAFYPFIEKCSLMLLQKTGSSFALADLRPYITKGPNTIIGGASYNSNRAIDKAIEQQINNSNRAIKIAIVPWNDVIMSVPPNAVPPKAPDASTWGGGDGGLGAASGRGAENKIPTNKANSRLQSCMYNSNRAYLYDDISLLVQLM